MWTSTESNCVVDLTSSGPSTNSSNPALSWAFVDQNGISNNPLENLTDFALNQPYTRRFIISPGAPTSYRFGFTCARRSGENSTNAEQSVVITHIAYGMTAEWANWNRAVYEPTWAEFGCTTNTSCPDPAPNDDAICAVVQPWGDKMWFYNGSYYASAFASSPAFGGDFYVDEALWGDSYIPGCIYPWHQSNVTIVLRPDWMMRLRFGQHCDFFPYTIVGRPRTSEMQQIPGLSPDCNYTLNVDQVVMAFSGVNSVDIYAPLSAWNISCPLQNSPVDIPYNPPYSIDDGTLWAVVFSVVGAVLIGTIVGVIFGVKKCKKLRESKKKEDKPAEVPEGKQSERR
jgi:hypothetical protein